MSYKEGYSMYMRTWWLLVYVVERVKEAVSSEGPQRQGPTHIYRDSSERPRSVPMQSLLGSVVLCLASTLRV